MQKLRECSVGCVKTELTDLQYYDELMKSTPDGAEEKKKAVSLPEIVYLCQKKSSGLYSCDISFKCKETRLFCGETCEEIANRTVNAFSEACRGRRTVAAELEKSKDGTSAVLLISDGEGNEIKRVYYKLFQGMPDIVISDCDDEEKKAVEAAFRKIGRIEKYYS